MKEVVVPSYKEGLKELRGSLAYMLPGDALEIFDVDAKALQKEHTSVLNLNIGDKATDFTLSNAVNKSVNLYEVLKTDRVVLTFYRGAWCPYCNLALNQYQAILPDIKDAGATLIAISPQSPDGSLNMQERNGLQFEVLSDNGNLIAKEYTTVHAYPKNSLDTMIEMGYDYDSYNSDEDSALPVPATFIIERDATISFARSEGADYRNRVEPKEIINALNK
ncbi:peroxiredoxin-like family protein [Allomuricauda sp. SCSIO 65647]|uniref:peroxiredoxin-like family protein n=1 Tax=Allomuricauda sp. SCSIO 65647 TaxID=2908843 RepID=UPI001F356DF2|nr:peroxiredoxin-like family protein [Muricauda sp. SCSIO 65647]UJH68609.1 AhpC/TSA family protein [Muricauda sp. SCSIO 65647]